MQEKIQIDKNLEDLLKRISELKTKDMLEKYFNKNR